MLLVTLALAALPAHADTVIYANLAGVAGFGLHNIGDFALGAEHVFGEHLGVVGEATLVHVHGDPTHATLYGGQVGLRLHAAPVDAPFVGLMAGAAVGGAKFFTAEHGGPYFHYGLTHMSLIPDVGYRWGLGERGAITARAGAGYGRWRIEADEQGAEVEAAEQRLRDRIQTGPVKVDLELSVGLRF